MALPSGSFIEAIRKTSSEVATLAGIQIDNDAIDRFLLNPEFDEAGYDKHAASYTFTFPLRFANDVAELNLTGILGLLNFGSAHDKSLRAATKRDAYESIRAFVFGLYLSSAVDETEGDLLSAKGIQTLTRARIAEMMQLELHGASKPHPMNTAIMIEEFGGPHLQFVQAVTDTLHETGKILQDAGYPDLGTFLLEALKEAERVGKTNEAPPDPDVFIERVVRALPAFRDVADVHSQQVYFFRKAIFLVLMVAPHFGDNVSTLPAPVNMSIPTILQGYEIINVSKSISPDLMALGTIFGVSKLSKGAAQSLRAASIIALDQAVVRAGALSSNGDKAWLKKITAPGLLAYMLAVQPDPEEVANVFNDGDSLFV